MMMTLLLLSLTNPFLLLLYLTLLILLVPDLFPHVLKVILCFFHSQLHILTIRACTVKITFFVRGIAAAVILLTWRFRAVALIGCVCEFLPVGVGVFVETAEGWDVDEVWPHLWYLIEIWKDIGDFSLGSNCGLLVPAIIDLSQLLSLVIVLTINSDIRHMFLQLKFRLAGRKEAFLTVHFKRGQVGDYGRLFFHGIVILVYFSVGVVVLWMFFFVFWWLGVWWLVPHVVCIWL